MAVIDYLLLLAMAVLGVIASVWDIREGLIPNRLLVTFATIGLITDIIYYGGIVHDLSFIFVINVIINSMIGLVLYATHTLAGGDCKMIPVLSLLYPAGMYLEYGAGRVTLLVALCLAILYGYVYLLFSSTWKIITGKTKIGKAYIRSFTAAYLKSYMLALIYVVFVNVLLAFVDRKILPVNPWIAWAACIIIAWTSGRIGILKKTSLICAVVAVSIGMSVYLRVIPVSINPRTYAFTAMLLIFRMTIRTSLYENILTSRVKKGMILSTFSSMLMQSSRIEGLPGLSSEDLGSRLSEPEAESVRRWGKSSKGQRTIVVVRKIPFAIFLTMGYISYYVIWRVVV